MIKKILISIFTILIIGGIIFYTINSKDNYDATKYYFKATKGLEAGSKIEFKLPDQFDKTHSLTDKDKIMIFAFSKETGHKIREFFALQDKNYFKKRHIVLIADISKMPVFVRNTFALPDLKKSSYPILLIYDNTLVKDLEKNLDKTKIIIAKLNNKEITKLEYATNQIQLKKLIEK